MNYIECTIRPGTNTVEAIDILIAELAEIGFESFTQEDSILSAYIPINQYDRGNLFVILENYQSIFQLKWKIKEIPQENWNSKWESDYDPIVVDNKCMVRATFHPQKEGIEYDIIIDPKMSFGTGHHETTSLMIAWLLENDIRDEIVLDMGCGTAVLAILAKLRGADAVDAVDIDEWACENSRENTLKNNCSDIRVLQGGVETIPDNTYDLILANINKNILLKDMSKYVSHLKNNGKIVFSGIYFDDLDDLKKSALDNQLSFTSYQERNRWIRAEFQFTGGI